jgi:hypothetical protein
MIWRSLDEAARFGALHLINEFESSTPASLPGRNHSKVERKQRQTRDPSKFLLDNFI